MIDIEIIKLSDDEIIEEALWNYINVLNDLSEDFPNFKESNDYVVRRIRIILNNHEL